MYGFAVATVLDGVVTILVSDLGLARSLLWLATTGIVTVEPVCGLFSFPEIRIMIISLIFMINYVK